MADYYAILTNTGKALEAAALANGTKITLIKFVVGDGNGQVQMPDPARTALVHEVYRNSISDLTVSTDQPNQIIAQLVMPANVGGFTVREIGLLTDHGELYAIANCATFDKPANGVSITMQFRLAVSDTDNVTLNVATGEGLFLRQDANFSDVKDKQKARQNLQLGSASTKDVGIGPGNVMQVGAFGLGGSLNHKSDAYNNAGEIYRVNNTSANSPQTTGVAGVVSLPCDGSPTTGYIAVSNAGAAWVGSSNTLANGVKWNRIYTTANKPTAQDTGALPISGGTLTGQLSINHADFINKNGYTTYHDGDGTQHNQAGGLRLTIADTILTEFYYNETAGKSAEVSLHNKYGSTDSYLSLRNDGLISLAGTNPRINFNNGTVYASDGNVNGSIWGGYLSSYIINAVDGRVDWNTFNREVGSRATVDWVNANFARKVPDYTEVGSYIYARSDTSSDILPNTVVSGSTLHAATGDGGIIGDALPGSWRSMGYSTRTNDAHRATLWIRVS